MARGTPGHFATPASVTGTGFRNYFRFGEWKIGTLLTAFFAAIVLLMIIGDAIAVLQLDRVETRAWRFYQADQKSLAILHVYLDVVTFRDTLTGLAHDQDPHEFASRATALRDSFLRDVTHAQQTLSSAPDFSQDPTILVRLETVRAALPAQVDSLLELVKVEDWQAVRFRLAGQVQSLIALSSSLVADVEPEVAQARARALEGVQRTRRQLYLVLPITALLMLLMAAMLGWYATRRISRPLAQLDVGAQALARGEFGYEVDLRGNDELADLARAFNYAAQQLHKLYDDIKRSEAYLAESNTRLEEAQRIAHVGYWEWDILTGRVNWSDETYRIYGMRPQERPMNIAACQEKIYPEDWQRGMKEALGSGARFNAECRVIRPIGEVRIAQFQGDVKRDASGQPYHMFGTVQDITDRKRAEEALEVMSRDLQESKTRLEEAQRIAHVGHWVWDQGKDGLTWSDETYRIFGLRPQERPMSVEAFQKMIHPQDREFLFRATQEARGGGRPDIEFRIVRPSGEVRIVHSQGAVTKDVPGQPRQRFGIIQDITDRKRAEEALQQSQSYLAEGQRLAHIGSWAFNPSGFFDHWSQELFKIYGLDPQKGAPTLEEYLAAVHPQDRDFMADTLKRMHAECSGCDVKKRIVRPDGEQRYIRWVGIPVVEGEVLKGFLGTAIDITEQELLTRKLERQQAHLTEAQKLTHTASWAWRVPDRNAVEVSEEFYRIGSFDPAEGAPTWEEYLERVHPEDRLKWTGITERAIVEKADYDHEFRILLPNGKVRWIRTVGHPVLASTGDLEGFVGSSTDITERKSAEQEREKLRQLEADLAHIDRVSTLGEMAASLAHEIKQPISAAITSANSCIEWLAHEPPNLDRARAAASRIDRYGNRAAEIIDRMRSFYRKSPPQRELVDMNGIIQEMLTLLKGEATRSSIAMSTDLSAQLPKIMVDRVQLQQVFMNLMLNGIEAMENSGGELTVKSQLQDGQLQFSVSDTGVGLPMEKMDQIFSAFFTTKPQGSGMGLAISRSIVESHGGRLWASANDGGGATFHFALFQGGTDGPAEAELICK
jgi:PAS domain S-box-containing protein